MAETSNAAPLAGRVALITGGGTGLGLAIGCALARRGADIAIASRGEDHLASGRETLERLGARVCTARCDVRDAHAVRRSVSAVEAELGKLDILVNNAAGNFIRPAETLGSSPAGADGSTGSWFAVQQRPAAGSMLVRPQRPAVEPPAPIH